jgi:hypothetical protein
MARRKSNGGIHMPQALLVGLCMYAITSIPVGIWFSSKIDNQVQTLNELKPAVSILQQRLAQVEGSNHAILLLLQDIQARLNSRNHAFNSLEINQVPAFPKCP